MPSIAANASRSDRFAASAELGPSRVESAWWKVPISASQRSVRASASLAALRAWVLIAAAVHDFSCSRSDAISALADAMMSWDPPVGLAACACFLAASSAARAGAILAFAASRVFAAA
ncbi:hypothetical protein HZ994_15355 [Akkermansiaceae bacterium]|nr:hypothetical protein HZ994_15355 [Akkermansiaceae bacterium]